MNFQDVIVDIAIKIEAIFTKTWVILGPVTGLLIGRFWHLSDASKKADTAVFKKFRETLSHEAYRNFIDDTWNMHYYPDRSSGYLWNYRQSFEDPANRFNDADLEERHAKFANALQELEILVSGNFAYPHPGSAGMNLQCVAKHGTERYQAVKEEVITLNNKLESHYNDYIAAAKKKLYI